MTSALLPAPIVWARRAFLGIATLDFVALVIFLVVDMTDHDRIVGWISGSWIYEGVTRENGIDSAVHYAVVSVSAVHLVITAMFLGLAVAIGKGRLRTRIRATVLMVVSTAVNVAVMTSPAGGVAQQAVMAVSIAVKLWALGLLWLPRATTAFYARPASGMSTTR